MWENGTTPTRYTQPLSPDFTSDGDWLLPILDIAWPEASGFSLDQWQRDLIRAVLETYPPGHPREGQLRYRQTVISMGRQNGKTEIAAAFGLYALLKRDDALAIGIASNADQARLVYDRTARVIRANPALAARFEKLTETRGLKSVTGGKYEIKASKSASLQGLPITCGIVDEVHLIKGALWTDLVNGTGGRPDCIVIGITTAGDEGSSLLKDLYTNGLDAINDSEKYERFGFFCWEASDARIPDDDEELKALLIQANPALATGRVDMDNVVSDVRSMPKTDAIRYRLNRFVASETVFIPMTSWAGCANDSAFPEGRVTFCVDIVPGWGYATIAAAIKKDGMIYTEIVASFTNPSLPQLVNACVALNVHSPVTFVIDGYSLKDMAKELQYRGLPVRTMTQGDQVAASSMFYAKVVQQKLRHGNDPLLSVQLPRTARKAVGEAFRISRADSSYEIDAVMATVGAVYAAETHYDMPIQVF